VQLRFKTESFPFKAESFKTNEVNAYFEYDQLVLEVSLPKKFLLTFSDKAKGTFYLRNKVEGFVLTNKKGLFLNLNYTIKPLNPYLSFEFNFSSNYHGKWEDIWLNVKEKNKLINPLEFYFFENLSEVVLNFSGMNDSKILNLEFELFTDLGNFWKKNVDLEVPYNSRVNVSFVFDNVNNASLILKFNYTGREYVINFGNVSCNPSSEQSTNSNTNGKYITMSLEQFINVGLEKVSYYYSKTEGNPCNISFILKNLPTYTNYTIVYKYNNKKFRKSWRIFTPYIKDCSLSGNRLNCGSYWEKMENNFLFRSKNVTTKIRNKKAGISYYYKFSYCWDGSMIKIWKCFLDNENSKKECNEYTC